MKRELVLAVGCILGVAACEASTEPPPVSREAALLPGERVEVDAAFDDAACYCEALLFAEAHAIPVDTAECMRDEDVDRYARNHANGDLVRFACTALSADAPQRTLPTLGALGGWELNGCDARAVAIGSGSGGGEFSLQPLPGFCRADLNYCLAQQMRLKVDSLVRAPSNRAVGDAIRAKVRDRFQRAGVEYASTLAYLGENCGTTIPVPPTCVRESGECYECVRLSTTDYGNVALQRMSDSVSQLSDVLAHEARSRMAVADQITPGGVPDTGYASTVWGGPSARIDAAATISGRGAITAGVRQGDAPFAARVTRDSRASEVVGLLAHYEVPAPIITFGPFGGWGAVPAGWANAVYNYLDAKILASQGLGPEPAVPTTLAAFLATLPTSPSVSPLRTRLSLTVEDIREGNDLAADLATTMDLDYTVTPWAAVSTGPGSPPVTLYTLALNNDVVGQRPPMFLQAAMTRGGVGVPPQPDPAAAPVPQSVCRAPTLDIANWYDFDSRQLDAVGASGAVQILRYHLLRIRTLREPRGAEFPPPPAWASEPAVDSALQVATGYVGPNWTDWRTELTLTPTGVRTDGIWTFWGSTVPAGATPVYATTLANALCLPRGRTPGTGAPCTAPDTLDNLGALTLYDTDGHVYRIRRITRFTAPLYIFWRRGAAGAYEYELVDVAFPTRAGDVHAFDGTFGDLFAHIMAKSADAPAVPAFNSLDLPSGLIPPLEHPLLDETVHFEESLNFYLSYATEGATRAQGLLETARAHEIDIVQNDRATDAQFAAAALAQQEVVGEVCGADRTRADCAVTRVETTLGDLGIGRPGVMPPAPGGLVDCRALNPVTLRAGWLGVDHLDGPAVGAYLGGALECARWSTLVAVSRVRLKIPVRVQYEVLSLGNGDFADVGGEVRQQFIALFRALDDLRISLRHLESTFHAAEVSIELAAAGVDWSTTSFLEDATCWVGGAIEGVGAIVGGAVLIATGGGAIIGAGLVVGGVGQLASLSRTCGEGDEEATRIAFGALRDAILAMDQITVGQDEARRLISSAASVDGRLNDLERRAQIARARRAVEERIASTSSAVSLPVWRALHGVETRRARDAVFRAQQLAFVARRAIEFRVATEMPLMTVAEPFAPAPASWVNDVFTLDTATTTASDGAHVITTPEALDDHVTRLRDFAFGYPFARRFSEGQDAQIVNLSVLAASDPVAPGELPASTPLVDRMFFKCRCAEPLLRGGQFVTGTLIECPGSPIGGGGGGLDPVPPPPGGPPCSGTLGGVEFAAYSFRVPDPLSGYFGGRLAIGNFNYRVNRVSVNLVGSALVDCTRSLHLAECYSDASIQYSMRHEGAVTLENFEHEHTAFFMEPGVIEHARALAAERVLTNPLSSADRTLLTDYERSEWWGRPLIGVYTLIIHSRPEIVWSNLEDAQILLRYDYWTRQE